jgi:chromosome segregation ATPase
MTTRHRRRRWVVSVVAVVLVAVALGHLIDDQVQARHRYDRAQASLGVTRHQTGTVSAQLAGLRRNLALLTSQVGSDTTALNQDVSQLQGAQAALAAAEAHVSQQSSQITALRTCLGGVERALNALSVDKQARAIAALKSVSSSCSKAAASGG